MSPDKQQRLKRFASDKATTEAVKEFVLDIYLRPRSKLDVHEQAAERIAINLFLDAWKELARFSPDATDKPPSGGQVGL